jgi:hypothetical protein
MFGFADVQGSGAANPDPIIAGCRLPVARRPF